MIEALEHYAEGEYAKMMRGVPIAQWGKNPSRQALRIYDHSRFHSDALDVDDFILCRLLCQICIAAHGNANLIARNDFLNAVYVEQVALYGDEAGRSEAVTACTTALTKLLGVEDAELLHVPKFTIKVMALIVEYRASRLDIYA